MEQTLFKKLSLYTISEDSAVKALLNGDSQALASLLITSAEKNGFSGDIFKSYIINLFVTHRNAFSLSCENKKDIFLSSLYRIAWQDIETLREILNIDLSKLFPGNPVFNILKNYTPVQAAENPHIKNILKSSSAEDIINYLISSYNTYGCGKISIYRSFKFDSTLGLVGIEKPDNVTFDELFGYETQRQQLIENTDAFLKGYCANNVLLVGARGTGKSSCVKALVNKYFERGLRLIEITKEQIPDVPLILATLKSRGCKFIIYLDDLSFDEQEIQYKYMKSLLEGGSESKPDNVLFYATGNRRHLIQEKWSDRRYGSDDAEIHTQDTLNEKLSLADRFGITITFPKPTPQQYIEIVKGLAKLNNIQADEKFLESEAKKWELNQKGLSGRTAKQFINNFLWKHC